MQETTMQETTAEDTSSESCENLKTLASIGPQVSDDKKDFETTKDRFRVTYEVDFKNDDPLDFRDFEVDINDRFGLVEFDSADKDSAKSFIVIADPGKYSIQTDVTPNNGATYTVKVEECSATPPESTTPEATTPESTTPETTVAENTTPVEGQSPEQPPADVSNPKAVMPGTSAVKKIPNTGGPPYLILSALALLGTALVVGRGILRR